MQTTKSTSGTAKANVCSPSETSALSRSSKTSTVSKVSTMSKNSSRNSAAQRTVMKEIVEENSGSSGTSSPRFSAVAVKSSASDASVARRSKDSGDLENPLSKSTLDDVDSKIMEVQERDEGNDVRFLFSLLSNTYKELKPFEKEIPNLFLKCSNQVLIKF